MKYWSACLAILTLLSLSLPPELRAQEVQGRVVPVEELQHLLVAQSAQRSQDIQEIQKLLSQEQVQTQVGNLVNLSQVAVALAALDDETLNQLAARSRSVNDEIEAGIATWGWVVIAAIVAFTIIVVVAVATYY